MICVYIYIYVQYIIYIYISILNVVCLLKGKKKAERHDCFSMPSRGVQNLGVERGTVGEALVKSTVYGRDLYRYPLVNKHKWLIYG